MKTLFRLSAYIVKSIKTDTLQTYTDFNIRGYPLIHKYIHNYKINTSEVGIRNHEGHYEVDLYTRYRFKKNGPAVLTMIIGRDYLVVDTTDWHLYLEFKIIDHKIHLVSYKYETYDYKISYDFTNKEPSVMLLLYKKIPLCCCQHYEQCTQYWNNSLIRVQLTYIFLYKEGIECRRCNNISHIHLTHDQYGKLCKFTLYKLRQKYAMYERDDNNTMEI
jgi:hypothetical protein